MIGKLFGISKCKMPLQYWIGSKQNSAGEQLGEMDRFKQLGRSISPDGSISDEVVMHTTGLICIHQFQVNVVSSCNPATE